MPHGGCIAIVCDLLGAALESPARDRSHGDARDQEEVPLMLREFVMTYFKRVLMIFPIVAIVTLIPPHPLDVKVASILAFFVILLIPQLVEFAVAHQQARRDDV